MKQCLVLVLVIFGASLASCNEEFQDSALRSKRESGYGTNHNEYSEPEEYYAAPSYQKSSYKGYGHDSGYGHDGGYHDDGYGHHGGYGYGYTTKKSKSKLGLLALLPLLAIPAIAALGIPVIAAFAGAGSALVPVTATLGTLTANTGRRKREAIYREVEKQNPKLAKSLMDTEMIATYLESMDVKFDLQDELMYNHLACSGLLDSGNKCLQRLSCEFNDKSNDDLPELEKQVSAIVLNSIMSNKKIPSVVKKEVKRAGFYGTVSKGRCYKFTCSSAQQNKLYKSFTGSS